MRNGGIGTRFSDRNTSKMLFRGILVLLSISVFVVLSPLCPKSDIVSYTDSSVFQYIGSSMLDGAMPYRDLFDHKGPLIYLINCLGWLLHGESGIWFIEVICLVGCAMLWFELSHLLNRSAVASFVVSMLGLAAFVSWIEGGNLTEEYCLPFLTIILFSYTVIITSKTPLSPLYALLTGASCAALFLIKYNALLFVIPLIVFELIALHRDGSSLLIYICCGVIGFALPTIASLVWLFVNDALGDYVRDYFLYNLSYAGSADFIDRLTSLSAFLNYSAVVISFAVLFIMSFSKAHFSHRAQFLFRGVLVAFLLGFMPTAGTGYTFGHYALFFIPFIVLSFSVVPVLLRPYEPSIQRLASSLIVVFMLVQFGFPSLQSAVSLTKRAADSMESQLALIEQVDNRVNRGDAVGIVGNACWVYLETETVAASSLEYVPAGITDYTPWFNAMYDDFKESKARVVLVDNRFADMFCTESFLLRYQLACDVYNFKVYELRPA